MSAISYTITNHQDFIRKFHEAVDTSVSYSDYAFNPWITTGKCFGKMQWDRFEVYGYGKFLIGKRLIIQVTGTVHPSQAELTFKFINRKIMLFSFIVLFWLGSLALSINFYLGLLILLASIIQFVYGWLEYYSCKAGFLKVIEGATSVKH